VSSVTLRGIAWGNERGIRPLLASIPRWREIEPDVAVEWSIRPATDFAHGDIGALTRDHDLVVLDHPHIGAAASDGLVHPLDAIVPAAAVDDQRNTVGKSFASDRWHGRSHAFAIDAACHVAVRRPDLVAEPDLPVGADWDAVLDLAARRMRGLGRVAISLRQVAALMCFFTICANTGEQACRDASRVVSRRTGRAALAILRRIARLVDPEHANLIEPDLLERMATTDEIGYVPLNFGYCNYSRPGHRPARLAFEAIATTGDGPRGAILGGTGLAVSTASEHAEAAGRYAAWLAGADYQRTAYTTDGGQPGHRVAWDDSAADATTGGFLSSTRATIEAAWLRPRYPGYTGFQERAGDVLAAAVWSDEPADDVLAAIGMLYRASVAGRSAGDLELEGTTP
jgi:multiple sugar transport system substrate-binding protein